MRKMSMIVLAALCLLWPMTGAAQGLPAFLDAVEEGLATGLSTGTAQAAEAMDQELTLALTAQAGRLEEGRALTLTLTAGNPRPVDTPVTLTLKLPGRLATAGETTWEAVLPAAKVDEQTGKLTPSVSTFTRDVTLTPGGTSETVTLESEMSMGTRFYRASMPLELCVADVRAEAALQGAKDGKLSPGDALAYTIRVRNEGTAAKDVAVELTLPEGVALTGGAQGFEQKNGRLSGQVRAEAAVQEETGVQASLTEIHLPVQIEEDVLEGDEDGMRLLAGELLVDGERVPLPRMQVCGPVITARLLPEVDELRQGEEMALRVVVVNSGLAGADVRLSCVLPEGLSLVTEDAQQQKQEATPAQAAPAAGDDPRVPDAEAVLDAAAVVNAEGEEAQVSVLEDGTLAFSLHMDPADEQDGAVTVNTRVVTLRVRADVPQENIREQMLGATLAWSTDGGETRLGEAVALRVYSPLFLGLSGEEWGGIFWAGLLLVITVSCLYAAVCVDKQKDDFVCD